MNSTQLPNSPPKHKIERNKLLFTVPKLSTMASQASKPTMERNPGTLKSEVEKRILEELYITI